MAWSASPLPLAPIPHVAEGPFLVRVYDPEVGGTNLTRDLCYNVGNISIQQNDREIEVPSDLYGGAEGTPADIQYLGAVIGVQIESRHYNRDNCMVLQNKKPGSNFNDEGLPIPFGQFFRANKHEFVLLLISVNKALAAGAPWMYVFWSARPMGWNPEIGLAANTFRCVFQCLPSPPDSVAVRDFDADGSYQTALPDITTETPGPYETYRVYKRPV
jgi:hypothetical protein